MNTTGLILKECFELINKKRSEKTKKELYCNLLSFVSNITILQYAYKKVKKNNVFKQVDKLSKICLESLSSDLASGRYKCQPEHIIKSPTGSFNKSFVFLV